MLEADDPKLLEHPQWQELAEVALKLIENMEGEDEVLRAAATDQETVTLFPCAFHAAAVSHAAAAYHAVASHQPLTWLGIGCPVGATTID